MNVWIAFSAGLLSFFSPCFLPLVPAYLIYITGLSFEELKRVRGAAAAHSLCFIIGFSFVFISLGVAASLLGRFLSDFSGQIRIIGGCLIIFMGGYLAGIIKLPWLDIEKRPSFAAKPSGWLGSILVGMVFAAGWSPCVGPVLAGILLLAGQSETVGQGILMLAAFSAGLGLPLFLAALAFNFSLSLIKRIGKYLHLIHLVAGWFFIFIGILLLTNYFAKISIWLIELTGFKGI